MEFSGQVGKTCDRQHSPETLNIMMATAHSKEPFIYLQSFVKAEGSAKMTTRRSLLPHVWVWGCAELRAALCAGQAVLTVWQTQNCSAHLPHHKCTDCRSFPHRTAPVHSFHYTALQRCTALMGVTSEVYGEQREGPRRG